MLSPAEAERLIFENIPVTHREDCPLGFAHGRVLRSDIRADRDLPPFDRVALDGYALRSSALASGLRRFRIGGLTPAGSPPGELGPEVDACFEVATGCVLPAGADCVVPVEEVRAGGGWAEVDASAPPAPPGRGVHRRGGDRPAGSVLVRAGVRLSGREVAAAAACGCAVLTVSQAPRIAVISTGSELVDVDDPVLPWQVRRSNDYGLRACLAAAGYPGADRYHMGDSRAEIEHRLWHILAEYDVVLATGGVSRGRFDLLPEELDRQGVRKLFHGVAQRPGKPFWFGLSARLTPVFALPGNPVSAFTCLHRYVLPALDRSVGLNPPASCEATLAAPFRPSNPRLASLPAVRVQVAANGARSVLPGGLESSGDLGALAETDGFIELPAGPEEFPAGYTAPYRPWL